MHRPTIHGYSDRLSVAPGETIEFKVSCEEAAPYRADLVRMIHGDTNPAGPGFREEEVGLRRRAASTRAATSVPTSARTRSSRIPMACSQGTEGWRVELFVQAGVVDPAVQALVSRFDASANAGLGRAAPRGPARAAHRRRRAHRGRRRRASAVAGHLVRADGSARPAGGRGDRRRAGRELGEQRPLPAVEIGGAGRTAGSVAVRPADSGTPLLLAGLQERAGEPWVGEHCDGKLEAPRILRGSRRPRGLGLHARDHDRTASRPTRSATRAPTASTAGWSTRRCAP